MNTSNPIVKALESAVITGAVTTITAAVAALTPLLHNPFEIAAVSAIGTAVVRFLQGLEAVPSAGK